MGIGSMQCWSFSDVLGNTITDNLNLYNLHSDHKINDVSFTHQVIANGTNG